MKCEHCGKRINNSFSYGETEEIRFLDNLGQFASERPNTKERRKELLFSYITASELRVNWDGIDRFKVRAHAVELLEKM